ncbi:MAG: nuclear transport factor 2 family protein [Rhizobium sp.]|nr:MAG: nuclear transport factor 2 family protein [Rhizobium sp.]
MHANIQLITLFYSAFQKRDGKAMAACYHPEVEFSDPVFQNLKGERAKAMWIMLCERAKDLSIEFSKVSADDKTGGAHWDAWYLFSATGRTVHNVIDARFEFKDGLIIKHTDTFDLHRWAGQALGLGGKLLGGTAFMQNKIRRTANAGLDAFMKKAGT